MKTILILSMTLGTGMLLAFQDEAKREVERPVKKSMDASKERVEIPLKEAKDVEKFDLSKTGIEWHKGMDSAVNKGKPLLLFHLLGNLDEVYC